MLTEYSYDTTIGIVEKRHKMHQWSNTGTEWSPLIYFPDVVHPLRPAQIPTSFWTPSFDDLCQLTVEIELYLHIKYPVKNCCVLLLL